MNRLFRILIFTLTALFTLCLIACAEQEATTAAATTAKPNETTAPVTTAPMTTVPVTTTPVTLSPEEEELRANEAYLATVSYLDFTLTGENTPYYVGRWFEKTVNNTTHTVTTTDGSHLYFLIDGAQSFDILFSTLTSLETPYFAYSIDGATPSRQLITSPTVTLPDSGKHTVRIIADGMTENESKWTGERGFAIKSIEPSEGGKLYGIKPSEKVIFFYGDSITEGIRALNMNANSNGNSATHAYSWYCAEALGAVPYFIGYGASGLVQAGSFHPMIDAIDYLSATRKVEDSPLANITPDLIVVNHGTNDALNGISTAAYEAALRKAIVRLQEKYPGVAIVYMVPFLEGANAAVTAQANVLDALAKEIDNLHIVHTKDWRLAYTDGNLHPNVIGAKKAGKTLAEEILAITGKDFFSNP